MLFSNVELIKRIGIYCFYEKDGIVDKYVEVFLEDFRRNLEKLIIVVNGKIKAEEKVKLEVYANEVIVRENKGFDIWGQRTGLLSIGWDKLLEYDEVVTANNTLMGPVYPLKDMFLEMGKRKVDFWGIARHYSVPFDPFYTNEYGYLPEHIQSYFMVYRKNLVNSVAFQKYWENLPELNTYEDAVGRHETAFTKKFSDLGYKWDTYVDTTDIQSLNANPIMNYPMLMIRDKKCPVFKRRIFFQDYNIALDATVGQPSKDLYNFLQKSGLYDVDLIWENILRTCHQADFSKNLHLCAFLPTDQNVASDVKVQIESTKVAVVAVIRYLDKLDSMIKHLQALPAFMDCYVVTDSVEKKSIIEKKLATLSFKKIMVKTTELISLGEMSLLSDVSDELRKYEYGCFVHDNKIRSNQQGCFEESKYYKSITNVLYSNEYVYQIIQHFIKEPRLGLLVPPVANHAMYYSNIGFEWHFNFDTVYKIVNDLNLDVPISHAKEPISSGDNMYWFRTSALLKMLDNKECLKIKKELTSEVLKEEVPALLRFFIVQSAGYYPAILMADYYARNEIDNLRYYIRNFNHCIKRNNLGYGTQRDMVAHIECIYQGKKIPKLPNDELPNYMKVARFLQRIMPLQLYNKLINIKRKIFGPYDLVK